MNKNKITYGFPQSKEEVKSAYRFVQQQLEIKLTHPRQEDYYLDIFETLPSLLIVAKSKKSIVGCAFGSKNPFDKEAIGEILIGELCVHPIFQGNNIGKSLLSMLETNAKKEGFTALILGARRGVEPFYFKCGFSANFFFQIENTNCLEELKKLTANYPIRKAEIDEGWTRLTLETIIMVPKLEQLISARFPDGYIHYAFTKKIE
ncbi:MAG: GNAT family N-acetyltransferase [Promethearchaeota archaeon]